MRWIRGRSGAWKRVVFGACSGIFCTEQYGHDVYCSFSIFVELAFAGSLDHLA